MSETEQLFYTIIQAVFLGFLFFSFHWFIPIVIIIVLIIYFRDKSKSIRNTICIIIIIATALSYFTVGYIAKSPIFVDETTQLNICTPDKNLYLENEQKQIKYTGKVYCFEKSKFDFETAFETAFNSDEIFDMEFKVGTIGQKLMKSKSLTNTKEEGDYTIVFSPIVLSKSQFFARNMYYGYMLLENENEIVFIPYEIWFLNGGYNDVFFTKIYSQGLRVNLEELL